ncbi:hypothetical protein ACF3MZ_31100 [Paenibacillaceae bacterium WGS1546]|uniref:hypothetical protein n=1 Tax=Cohnella sp. WGS1546 TaxID=3366810 RepID=UPI00372D7573
MIAIRYGTSTLLFLTLAFLLPLLFCAGELPEANLPFAMNAAIVAYAAAMLSFPAAANKERILELTFWLFAYVFLGIVPLVQLTAASFPWPDAYGDRTVATAQLVALAGMAAYHAGILLGKPPGSAPKEATERTFGIGPRGFLAASAIAVLVALSLLLASGGIQSLFVPRNAIESAYESKSLNLIADQLVKVPMFVCLLVGLALWKQGVLKTLLPKAAVAALLLLSLIVSNPVSTARYWFGSVLLTLCLTFVPWKKVGYVGWTMGYLLLFIVLFPYTDLFRNTLDGDIQTSGIAEIFVRKGDYDAFQMLLNAIEYVEANGIEHGRQLLGAVLFWVPRSLWVDKPLSSGQLLGEASGYAYTNLSSPFWAEGYLNGGLAGVIVLFAAYGFLSRRMQEKYARSQDRTALSLNRILVPFLSAYQIFLLRGDLMNAFAYLSAFLLCAWLLTRIGRKKPIARPAARFGEPVGRPARR